MGKLDNVLDMYKDSLFELIRREEVVLFVGAGLSLYAGYPSGAKLKDILFQSLSEMEKSQIDFNLSLNEFAEEFFRIKGNNRNKLIKILEEHFIKFQPISTSYHDKLSLIAHFKTIITTNYDKLFENSYGDNCKVVFSSKQIPYLEKEKTNIFKIHGDLQDPDSVIITKSDYNNFFKNTRENEIFWTVVKERISTKSVLFLGYNLEDPNISIVFEKITEELKTNRKECFLIAPNLPQHKINDLSLKGIHYLNTLGEKFIDELIENIKDNIFSDFNKKYISADVFRDFLNNFGLLPDLKSNSSFFELNGIHGKNGAIYGDVKLKFKNDPDFVNKFSQIIKGAIIDEIELSDDKLESIEVRLAGLKMPNEKGKTSFVLKSSPKGNFIVDIEFENGFEIHKIPLKIYGGQDIVEIHFEYENLLLKIRIFLKDNISTFKLNTEYKNNFIRVNNGIKLFTFLENIGLANKYKIIKENQEEIKLNFLPAIPELVDQAKLYKKYFEDLKKIQEFFDVTFSNFSFDSIKSESFDLIKKIMSVINDEPLNYVFDGELTSEYNSDFDDEKIQQLREINDLNLNAEFFLEEEIIYLHNQKINLGFKKIEIMEPYVANIEDIEMKSENNKIIIKSKCERMKITYSKDSY